MTPEQAVLWGVEMVGIATILFGVGIIFLIAELHSKLDRILERLPK